MTHLTVKEKCERATDLIGLLAGFGTSYEDARQIGSVMYRQLTEMKASNYAKLGEGVGTMTALLDKRDGIPPALGPTGRARIFHEPEAKRLHVLYKDGDENIPPAICDRNGSVALGCCKVCGRGEIELDYDNGECPGVKNNVRD